MIWSYGEIYFVQGKAGTEILWYFGQPLSANDFTTETVIDAAIISGLGTIPAFTAVTDEVIAASPIVGQGTIPAFTVTAGDTIIEMSPVQGQGTVPAFTIVIPCIIGIGNQIVADHNCVDKYNTIPDSYINEVKKLMLNVPGASHGGAYMYGLDLLEAAEAKFVSNCTWTGAPETYTADHLRGVRTWRSGAGWATSAGEENWYTNAAGIAAMKAHLAYMRSTLSNPVSVFMFGWCWDMTWHNGVTAEKDPVYDCGWAGASVSGPEGDLAWGLDADDTDITGNSVCMDTYLDATKQYIEYDALTKTLFTTGPVDGNNSNSELGYQREVKQQYIRDYVAAHPEYALFDYADILYYNDDNEKSSVHTWDGHNYYGIHDDNAGAYDGGNGDCHIGEAGCLRLGKALWWMLARMAGWQSGLQGQGTVAEFTITTEEIVAVSPIQGQGIIPAFATIIDEVIIISPITGQGIIPNFTVIIPGVDVTIDMSPVAGAGIIPGFTIVIETVIVITPIIGLGTIVSFQINTGVTIICSIILGVGSIPTFSVGTIIIYKYIIANINIKNKIESSIKNTSQIYGRLN